MVGFRSTTFSFAWLFAFGLAATPAGALQSHVYVSAIGVNSGTCGAITAPCQTFAVAETNVQAGGEIDVLNSGNYGPVTITKALSIVNNGVGTVAIYSTAAGNAITINAGANDSINLQGLTLNGLGVGTNGIHFNAGGSLGLSGSSVSQFTGIGVNFTPNDGGGAGATLVITGGGIFSNGTTDVEIKPLGGTGVRATLLNGCQIAGSTNGIVADATASTVGLIHATVSNCALHNLTNGVSVLGSAGVAHFMVERTDLSHMTNALTTTGANGSIALNASTLANITTIASGDVLSFGNNGIL